MGPFRLWTVGRRASATSSIFSDHVRDDAGTLFIGRLPKPSHGPRFVICPHKGGSRASALLPPTWKMERKRSPGGPPEESPIPQRMRFDDCAPSLLAGFPSPPTRTSASNSDPVHSTTRYGGTDTTSDLDFDPLSFLEGLSVAPDPSTTSTTQRYTYRADFDSLPLDFQVLTNPYLPNMASPPLVPADSNFSATSLGASACSPLSPQAVSPLLSIKSHSERYWSATSVG